VTHTQRVLLVFAQFLLFTVLIVVVARVLLYQPAKNITDLLGMDHRKAGQLLGYLTSSPELIATAFIAVNGLMLTVAYNILASNIINVILALSAAAYFRHVRDLAGRGFRREHWILLASIAIPVMLLVTDQIRNIVIAPAFLLLYVLYLMAIRHITSDSPTPLQYHEVMHRERPHRFSRRSRLIGNGVVILAALVALYLLGDALGNVIVDLGATYGVPAIVIGTIVGVVTSLPELTTFFASYSAHRETRVNRGSEEVMHNLLASNAANLLIVQNLGLVLFFLVASG
jgi:Ca2+/Na+ antiporter